MYSKQYLIGKILGQTGLSSLGRTTGLGERKMLNSKPGECCCSE